MPVSMLPEPTRRCEYCGKPMPPPPPKTGKRGHPFGRKKYCSKECADQSLREWKSRYRECEEYRAYIKRWHDEHKEQRLAENRANREQKIAYCREWRKRNAAYLSTPAQKAKKAQRDRAYLQRRKEAAHSWESP